MPSRVAATEADPEPEAGEDRPRGERDRRERGADRDERKPDAIGNGAARDVDPDDRDAQREQPEPGLQRVQVRGSSCR